MIVQLGDPDGLDEEDSTAPDKAYQGRALDCYRHRIIANSHRCVSEKRGWWTREVWRDGKFGDFREKGLESDRKSMWVADKSDQSKGINITNSKRKQGL